MMISATNRFLKLFCLVLAMFAADRQRAYAHPHVWIDVVSDILFTRSGEVTGLKHSWRFDEAYSVLAVQGLDKNRDGKYTRRELAPLLKRSLESLKDWEYFSYIKINGKNKPLRKLRNAAVRYEKGKIVIEFELHMKRSFDATKNNIRFSVYDRSFYNLLTFAEDDPVWLGRYTPDSCSFMIEPSAHDNRNTVQVDDSYIESLGVSVNVGAKYAEWIKLEC